MAQVRLTRWDWFIGFFLGFLLIAHYMIPPRVLWVHIALFWLFQIPILIGGATRGIRGGLTIAVIATAALLPHAVGLSHHHGLSANTIWMDLASLYTIGFTTGWLRDRWRREQEMGERARDLRRLERLVGTLRRDLSRPLPAMRGLLYSLDPIRDRVPAIAPAVRGLDLSLRSLEDLTDRLDLLRVDSRFGLVRFDRILSAAEGQLRRIASPAPILTTDWRCRPPIIPASATSLGSSLAVLALHVAPPAPGVQVTVSSSLGWILLHMAPRGLAAEGPPEPWPRSLETGFALACQVIEAHGGHVDSRLDNNDSPHLQIRIPSALQIRPVSTGQEPRRAVNEGRSRHRAFPPHGIWPHRHPIPAAAGSVDRVSLASGKGPVGG